MNQYEAILNDLKEGKIKSYHVKKEVFAKFREILVKHEDFKHFRGEAKQGGDIIYTYLEVPRA